LAQFVVFAVAPPEGTAADWFALFQKNPFLGLLAFESLLILYVVLSALVSLALFVALRTASPSLTAIFLILSILGGMAFIAARPALEMLSLSNQYAVATTDAQQAAFLAAGEAMLAIFHGAAFQVSYLLGSITGLIIAAVMLRSCIFSKTTAYVRMASSVLDFGIFVPTIGLFISLFSVVFLMIFNILIARRLFQLGQTNSSQAPSWSGQSE
jgi:large-conductance mechanosensitive channel